MTDANAEALLEGLLRWVKIETHTPAAANLDRLMGMVAGEASGFGAGIRRFPGRDGRGGHLLVTSPWGGNSAPYILVMSHLDTVHPLGTIEKALPVRRDGDKVYGPGIFDMKASAFIALAAMRELAEARATPPLPVWHLFTSDEEVGSQTSRDLIEDLAANAKYCLVTEPTRDRNEVVTARKGVGRFTISVEGRPSHSGVRHEEGRSAIRELAHQILQLEAMTDYERGITVNVGEITGGSGINVVPQFASAEVDLRVPTPALAEEMLTRIGGLQAVTPDVRVTVTGGMNRPPFDQSEGSRALFEHVRSIGAELGLELRGIHTGGGSDANFVADRVPVIDGLGALGNGAHTLDEHILVSSLVPRMTLMRRLYETLA
ncbi:M20 family metallopeptidase [Stappia sp. F7233]|uniref:M20 family metallopeptidase n=1 Tax=Stappia albiluteola TaxID=2758565 RepID=A0A839ADE6_9HYPH|nr:M20 family metallopeptidase [Stappia albiluteola]MBA5776857.1 M20 family metallopeptidase [Stappia albiluteola]